MPERRRKFSSEFRDEAVKMVIETSRPIAEVARELGINEGTLGNWCKLYRQAHAGGGQRPGPAAGPRTGEP